MKSGVIGEIIADRTVDWSERIFESPWFDRACWAATIGAILYFAPFILRTLIG